MKIHAVLAASAVTVAAGSVLAAPGQATTPAAAPQGETRVAYAMCAKKSTGKVRLVPAGAACRASEVRLAGRAQWGGVRTGRVRDPQMG